MDNRLDTLTGTEFFKLAPGDMDHLFRRSGLTGNPLSIFRYNAEQAAVSSPSALFKALAESPFLSQIAKCALEPDLKIMFQNGGAGRENDRYWVMLSADSESVLAHFVNREGDLLLMLFPRWQAYLQWWADLYTSEGMSDYKAVFPAIQELEVLVCALHCLDIYRRSYLESLLDYRGEVSVSLSREDFIQLLKRALASGDQRWLLPSLFELVPGLKNSAMALKPEHLKKIEDLEFISSNENTISLTEKARLMGTEFLTSWMGSVGWQATALIKGEERNLSRVFMAPTAFANHLFSFESGGGSGSRFRHQASTRTDLIKTLNNWMEALQKVTGILPVKAESSAVDMAKGQKLCPQCGSELRPSKKFCTKCGQAIENA